MAVRSLGVPSASIAVSVYPYGRAMGVCPRFERTERSMYEIEGKAKRPAMKAEWRPLSGAAHVLILSKRGSGLGEACLRKARE